MQVKALSGEYWQLKLTDEFYEKNWARLILAVSLMSQVSPETTRWNVLQFHTIPGCARLVGRSS